MHRRLLLGTVSTLAAGTLALTACTGNPSASPSTTAPNKPSTTRPPGGGPGRSARPFERFGSCDELLSYLRTEALARVTPWGLDGGWYGAERDTMGGMPATTTAASAAAPEAAPGATGSSDTNTQEVGIDEGDSVETDGRYVYAVENGTLQVVDTKVPSVVGRLDLGPAAHQLLLDGSRLTIVTSGFGGAVPMPAIDGREFWPGPTAAGSLVRVVDVSDPAHPAVVHQTELEGQALATRAAGGRVRIVMHTRFADRLPLVHPNGSDSDVEEKALDRNREIIEEAPIEEWLPRFIGVDANGTEAPPRQAVACDQIGRPATFAGLGLTWVATAEPAATPPTFTGSAGVVSDGQTTYASSDRLYVATTRQPDVTGDVLPNRPEPLTTDVHAFDLTSPSSVGYLASGSVPGTLLNQFALSEHEGVLRVALTEPDQGFGQASSSAVRTLRIEGDRLIELGAVVGLGQTEQIRAVRFLGGLGYVVTFRQTDPLYVIDLRDPAAPKAVGELKIPGYSAYLHPIGDGLLLGVGQEATADGRTLGAQLSLFDVRDPAAPAQLSTLKVGGQTTAEFDHHAFLWWPEGGQAVVTVQDWDSGKQQPTMAAVVARVVGTRLATQGSVSHPRAAGAEYPMPVDRALVVDGRLVTVSPQGLMVSDLGSLTQLGWAPFVP